MLTRADVDRLLTTPSADVRADLAARVAALWRNRDLAPNEYRLAEDIVRALLRDVDARVRFALADTLKSDPRLPRDIAMALVDDLDHIAVPMLNTSLVFSEADLIEVVRTRSEACRIAIAGRDHVPAVLADALVESRSEAVAVTLMRNDGAEIGERTGAKVIDIFSGSELVMDAMAERRDVPARLVERLVTIVSEHLRQRLRREGRVAAERLDELVTWSRERALVDKLDPHLGDVELLELCEQLQVRQRLSPQLMLRALCLGRMRLFEAAMSRLAGIDLAGTRDLVRDSGRHGLRSLCVSTAMPVLVYDVARFAVRVGYLKPDGSVQRKRRFRLAIGAQYGEAAVTLDDEALLLHLASRLRDSPVTSGEGPALRLVRD